VGRRKQGHVTNDASFISKIFVPAKRFQQVIGAAGKATGGPNRGPYILLLFISTRSLGRSPRNFAT